ncbi:hypothetical protein ABZ807_05540 [Micromonospora sp. NPDC047548]|uniref:hypothetical protein n=1 Tax=Micromonospora sp. NPDC047548 TaxID=3155624 RepID=UPI0033E0B45B
MGWAPAYLTDVELKDFTRIDDAIDDVEVVSAIEAASRAVDNAAHPNGMRQFGKVAAPEERRYTARWRPRRRRWVVEIDDLMTTGGLAVSVPAGTITAYTLTPINAAKLSRPWTRLAVDPASPVQPTGDEFEVAITASWGWTATPGTVKSAVKLQASRFLSRRDSPYGIAGSPDQGSELRLLAKLDPDVEAMLKPFVRESWVVG